MRDGLVGKPGARVVHGFSGGADVVVVGAPVADHAAASDEPPSASTVRALRAVGATGRLVMVAGSTGDVLAQLARIARDGEHSMAVVAGDLVVSEPALLDLLDSPRSGTAALTVAPEDVRAGLATLPPARVGADGHLVESLGTGLHPVSQPNRALPGILRVAPADRPAAARLWTAAASCAVPGGTQPWSLAVLALVRGGVPVQAVALGPFAFRRGDAVADGAPGSPWEQRLRASSRGGDGLVSTLAVRPLSRRLTAYGLGHGWQPNPVTMASLGLGLAAAALVLLGQRWSWALAAVLLVLALVVDCTDGELARFQRRFSPLGAWLDAVGDRVKEYAVLAALAGASAREGRHLWVLASVVLAVVSARHFEDNAYRERLAGPRSSRPALLPLQQTDDGGDPRALAGLTAPASGRQRALRWAKQVAHMPIAERYLVMVLGLLLFRADWLLWALLLTVGLSLLWSQGGRTVKALLRRDGWRSQRRGRQRWGPLDHELDLGVLARGSGRLLRMPAGVALAGAVLLGASVALRPLGDAVPVAAAVVGAVVTGAAARPALLGRLVWQLPALLWLAESAVVIVLAASVLSAGAHGVAYGYLAAVAYHRYDVGYRLRDTGKAVAPWLALAGLGTEVRVLVLLLVAAAKPEWLGGTLAVLAVGLGLLYAGESAVGWRRWLREEVAR